MSEPRPKVSVVMISYNHEKYIEQAVRSVLMQETDFEYEIIIGEDCSTDRTREILVKLQQENPEKMRLILHHRNMGMIPNFVSVLGSARGQYIALLEGDDYWTSPHKLQRQVDYMEAHLECAVCFHGVSILDQLTENGNTLPTKEGIWSTAIDHKIPAHQFDLANLDFVPHTCSALLRSIGEQLPEVYFRLRAAGDYPLFTVWLHKYGGFLGFLPDCMGVYRRHSGGVWSGPRSVEQETNYLRNSVHDQALMASYFQQEGNLFFYRIFLYRKYLYLFRLLNMLQKDGAIQEAKRIFEDELITFDFARVLHRFKLKTIPVLWLSLYCPWLYRGLHRFLFSLRKANTIG